MSVPTSDLHIEGFRTPEQDLWLGVLARAFEDAISLAVVDIDSLADDRFSMFEVSVWELIHWAASRKDGPGSLLFICDSINREPEQPRREILSKLLPLRPEIRKRRAEMVVKHRKAKAERERLESEKQKRTTSGAINKTSINESVLAFIKKEKLVTNRMIAREFGVTERRANVIASKVRKAYQNKVKKKKKPQKSRLKHNVTHYKYYGERTDANIRTGVLIRQVLDLLKNKEPKEWLNSQQISSKVDYDCTSDNISKAVDGLRKNGYRIRSKKLPAVVTATRKIVYFKWIG